MNHVPRRSFLSSAGAALGAMALAASRRTAPVDAAQRPAPLDPELVRTFVVAAHARLDEVKALLEREPRLVNATWDWGGGDFETALGGASHMGRPDIAGFLLSRGARIDLFCAAMLGRSAMIKACLEDDAAIVHVRGPHGITLLKHAQAAKQSEIEKLLLAAGAG